MRKVFRPRQSFFSDKKGYRSKKKTRTLDLAIIDTGGPAVEEWYVLETFCRPRSVFIVNSVFALHEGWIAARLRRAGWKEVLSGTLHWGAGFPQMLNLVEETFTANLCHVCSQ